MEELMKQLYLTVVLLMFLCMSRFSYAEGPYLYIQQNSPGMPSQVHTCKEAVAFGVNQEFSCGGISGGDRRAPDGYLLSKESVDQLLTKKEAAERADKDLGKLISELAKIKEELRKEITAEVLAATKKKKP
jgi:hypothetical protein